VTFTAEDKRKCAQRELQMRLKVYPRWINEGRISHEKASREIELMEAIVRDYVALEKKELLL